MNKGGETRPEAQWHSRKHTFSVTITNEEKYQQEYIGVKKKKVIFLQLALNADEVQHLQTISFSYYLVSAILSEKKDKF